MPSAGLFITLYDEDTLNLYLDRGIYSFLMPPIYDRVSSRSRHYHALADYASIREGAHVFFFLKRRIIYGGQTIGFKDIGSFYLNGVYSPLGRRAGAKLYWDESTRRRYTPTDKPGVFEIPNVEGNKERCQPYLIRFKDNLALKGQVISSDQLYWELGKYPYPLPSNSISDMSFCTLTPGETEIALALLRQDAIATFPGKSSENVNLEEEPLPFDPKYGIVNLHEAMNEAHLEATIIANPSLLPAALRPTIGDAICRQVPVSPFKPFQMDRADVCYYSINSIAGGTIPNTIIELKNVRVGNTAIVQVARYLDWLYRVIDSSYASGIVVYLFAPSFSVSAEQIPSKYQGQIRLVTF